jgi:hypothetical protein
VMKAECSESCPQHGQVTRCLLLPVVRTAASLPGGSSTCPGPRRDDSIVSPFHAFTNGPNFSFLFDVLLNRCGFNVSGGSTEGWLAVGRGMKEGDENRSYSLSF